MALTSLMRPPERSEPKQGDRAALRAAIKTADRVRAAREKLEGAIGRAEKMVASAEAEREKAESAAQNAQERSEAALLAALKAGRVAPTDKSMTDARARVAEAAAAVDMARNAHAALASELLETGADEVEAAVEDAAKGILQGSIDQLIKKAVNQRDALWHSITVMRWLMKNANYTDSASNADHREISNFLDKFINQPIEGAPGYGEYLDHAAFRPATAPWDAALEGLKRDPDFVLPEF